MDICGQLSENAVQLSSFYLADNLYGVNIQDIKEINNETHFTHIPHSCSEVRGYVNIRGQIFLIFDLRIMLGFERAEVDDNSKIILFKSHVGPSFGVLIDKIGDVIEVKENEIETRELNEESSEAQRVIVGTCKLEEQLLTILDSRLFIKTAETENS